MGVLWAALALPAGVAAQSPPAEAPSEPQQVSPDSPRASLARYLELARDGNWVEAATYLDAPPGANRALVAERLKAVFDHHVVFDLDVISPLPTGQAGDGLPAWVDRVAEIPVAGGKPDAVRMARRERTDGARWVFTRATVQRVDPWYAALPDRWLRENLAEWLLQPGPQGLFWWQWLALPVLALLAWGFGRLLGWLAVSLIRRLARQTKAQWDDLVAARLSGPATLGFAVGLAYFALPWLLLPRAGEAFLHRVMSAGFFLVFFWALVRAVAVVGDAALASPWAKQNPGSANLVPLTTKVAKVAVVAIALVAVISQFGYPVASLLAGLGLGGLAFALAAQKTVENLFGSVSLGVDQPFRVGDFVRVEDFVGTVEAIGLRSTRFRTLDRTLITIPNGRLAEMRLESFAARDRMRLYCTLGLVFGTTAEQLRKVLEGVEAVLRAHPKIWPDAMTIRFVGIGASSLDVDVMAWFQTADWNEFQACRQEVLLGFVEVVEKAGTGFAFPTQTVHLAKP